MGGFGLLGAATVVGISSKVRCRPAMAPSGRRSRRRAFGEGGVSGVSGLEG